jgi:hypothetical protein
MKKLWSIFLIMAASGALLALGASTAGAYFPPLQLSATWTSNSVSRAVYHPKRHQEVGATSIYGGADVEVVNLQQQNGVIAWVLRNGASYSVYCSVYDPGPDTIRDDMQGPFSSVSQLTVRDGVVAYVATEFAPGAVPGFRYTTYDPLKGAWQNRIWLQMDSFTNLQVTTKDGVVLRRQELVFISGVLLEADIYDAALGKWTSHIVYVDQAPYVLQSYSIANATVTITRFTGNEWVTETHGYDHWIGDWYQGATKPMACFAVQFGGGLWGWFTDLSIGAVKWNWSFGDGSFSTERSLYHIYAHGGVFPVTQDINSGASIYTKTFWLGLVPQGAIMLLLMD